MRTGFILTLALTAATAMGLTGCKDDAAKHHEAQAKALQKAIDEMAALSPDPQAAADEAKIILTSLKRVDVASGPLANVRSSLSAQAQMTIARATVSSAAQARLDAASLSGQIESKVLALRQLEALAQHATFERSQLGGPALEQDINTRRQLQGDHEQAVDAAQARIDELQQERDALAADISDRRQRAHALRSQAADQELDTALDSIDASGAVLKALAPDESRLDALDLEIESLRVSQVVPEHKHTGEAHRIDVNESELTQVDAFVRSRDDQISDVRRHVDRLSREITEDASALSELELGKLSTASAEAIKTFEAAATDAQRAARQGGRSPQADKLLELSARQAALSTSTSRYLSLERSARLMEQVASLQTQAAALSEDARSLTTQRDAAMQQTRDLLQSARTSANQAGQGPMADSIRRRLESVQSLLDGKPITVEEPALPPPPPPAPAPAPPGQPASGDASGSDVDTAAATAAALAYVKDGTLAGLGDDAASTRLRAMYDCQANPGLCEAQDLGDRILPEMSSLNKLAASTFRGPEAAAIGQIQMFLDPQMLRSMIEPMLGQLKASNTIVQGDTVQVTISLPPESSFKLRLRQIDGQWKLVGGEMAGMALGGQQQIQTLKSILSEMADLRSQVERKSISAAKYLEAFQILGERMQKLNGVGTQPA
ncbi:MAG: hypothetical protein MK101_02940 [Phycisphaerales bacterium]|nr:hypothetical protein [Phycisphaerales bacterium]